MYDLSCFGRVACLSVCSDRPLLVSFFPGGSARLDHPSTSDLPIFFPAPFITTLSSTSVVYILCVSSRW